MNWPITLLTLLHILIPIYWLGGDLGAFYSARFLIDARRSVPERMLALTILNNIDMAPRTTLILAFPTGFTLAVVKGWLAVSHGWLGLVWVAFLAWLALAWVVHLRHGPAGVTYKKVDIAVRYVVLTALAGIAAAALMLAVLLSMSSVSDLFEQRASFNQSYDGGRFGRFGRHILGAEMALDLPLGIGPLQFNRYFPEDTHNS
ncbi:hypothetical protein KXW38_009279, partial [Aspergillus fumigatus]